MKKFHHLQSKVTNFVSKFLTYLKILVIFMVLRRDNGKPNSPHIQFFMIFKNIKKASLAFDPFSNAKLILNVIKLWVILFLNGLIIFNQIMVNSL